jgi:sec-independent protein translocase protein TatA
MDIGPPELIIILIVVLLIFGPGRIVKLAHELGASIRQFRAGLDTPPDSDETDSIPPKR